MNTPAMEKILLVDDNKHLIVTIKDFLEFQGFRVTTASDGEQALMRLKEDQPDLVILDISMPGMGGIALLREMRDASGRLTCPVLILTARALMEDFFKDLDVDGFLAKPCDEATLLRTIRDILARHRATPAPPAAVKVRILVAENSVERAARLRQMIEQAGYELHMAISGPEALELAATTHPHVIVLKEVLEGMNGKLVGSLVKSLPSLHHVKIVLYDESITPEERRRHSFHPPAGVDRFIASADLDDIMQSIRELSPPLS